jgi:gluconate:H+ symporter, GntP family
MPLLHALLLLAAVVVLIFATQSWRVHPFFAIIGAAAAFGWAVGLSTGLLGKAFGAGFSQAVYSPGLVIIAAGLVTGLAETSAASDWLTAKIARWRRLGSERLALVLGLIAGMGAVPATAFAILTPLLRAAGSGAALKREVAAIAPALAISASHGLVLPSPVPIAAAAILGAAWSRVALFGLPLAVLLVAIGAIWARWLPALSVAAQPSITEPPVILEKRGRRSAIVLLAATAVPLSMLIVQSLGDIPSEPLGGGPDRELILAFGRPLILFFAALGIMIVGLWGLSVTLLADTTWPGRILGNLAGVLLIVGAAGGLQKICQETGMAELLGERLLGWHVGGLGGLLVPFLIAMLIKTLQGSSLVAAITTAGMVQPILAPLGIDDANAKALATLAIGAGAMTISHVNDEYFWLVSVSAGLRPLPGLTAITVGTLLQGLAAVAALLAMFLFVSNI